MDAFSERLRRIRRGQSLTLKDLSALTGLSVSFLSEIERGLAQPSMASLKKIRKALGVSLFSLTDERGDDLDAGVAGAVARHPALPREVPALKPQVVRAGQRKKLGFPGLSSFYEMLTPDLNRRLEVLYFKAEPGFDTGPEDLVDPPGEKCMVILSGSCVFRVGDEEFHLNAGDSLSYAAEASVSWTVTGEQEWEGILVVTPPHF